jgi:hypothetical protein
LVNALGYLGKYPDKMVNENNRIICQIEQWFIEIYENIRNDYEVYKKIRVKP